MDAAFAQFLVLLSTAAKALHATCQPLQATPRSLTFILRHIHLFFIRPDRRENGAAREDGERGAYHVNPGQVSDLPRPQTHAPLPLKHHAPERLLKSNDSICSRLVSFPSSGGSVPSLHVADVILVVDSGSVGITVSHRWAVATPPRRNIRNSMSQVFYRGPGRRKAPHFRRVPKVSAAGSERAGFWSETETLFQLVFVGFRFAKFESTLRVLGG